MKKFEVFNHEPSLLPDGEWKLVFADEFDGDSLDKSKWSFRKHIMRAEHPFLIEDEGLKFENSNIHFKLIEKDRQYYSCQLQTGENWHDRPNESKNWLVAPFSTPKSEHKFGYYECRCKLQKEKGDIWWSAFWLQSPIIGTHIDPKKAGVEVDIMESFKGGTYQHHYLHWGGYSPENHQFATTFKEHRYARADEFIPIDTDEFHRFGCLWEEDGYTFFVDGKQCGRKLTEAVSHTECFVLLGTEVFGAPQRGGGIPGYMKKENKGDLPQNGEDEFVVDYVRVFDLVK